MHTVRPDTCFAAESGLGPPAITNHGNRQVEPTLRFSYDSSRSALLGANRDMKRNLIETIMGGVVLAVAAFFLVFAYSTADVKAVAGYTVTAKFDRVDGLNPGSDVRMSGIKVGTVLSQRLDPKDYLAVVTLSIDPAVKLPADTSASITADSLLGSKYLNLSPGGAEEMLKPGGEIRLTQGSVDLFALLGQMIFSQTGRGAPSGPSGGK